MNWKIDLGMFEIEFQPEGLIFSKPVDFKMFYKLANFAGVKEQKINLFYFNETKKLWTFVGGERDTRIKILTAKISHFSRYALAHSE